MTVTPETVTVGNMRKWLARYPEDVKVDVFMLGEDRLPITRLFNEVYDDDGEHHEWPMLVVAWKDIQ